MSNTNTGYIRCDPINILPTPACKPPILQFETLPTEPPGTIVNTALIGTKTKYIIDKMDFQLFP